MIIEEKLCVKCKKIKHKSQFFKNKKNPDGYKYSCKDCCKKYVENNQHLVRNAYLKRQYGISLNDYNRILKNQNNCCAICKTKSSGTSNKQNFCVDHCHKTGTIRGLLCDNCNKVLGIIKDNNYILGMLSVYLLEKRWTNNYQSYERIV